MRLGIIGNGDSANSFAGAAHFVEGVELAAVAGRNLERVKPLADKVGAPAVSIEQLLEMKLDCVAVSTPPGLHGPHALPFIRKGVHMMIEKPMALAVEDCDRLIDEAEKAGVRMMVTQTHRYNPHGRKGREIVTGGRYGRPISVHAFLGHNYFGGKRKGWQLDPEMSGGGVTFNPFIHMVDFARFMADSEVKNFRGHVGYHKEGYSIEGDVHCFAECESGVVAVIHVDGYGHQTGFWVDVILEKGAMLVRPGEKRIDILVNGAVAESVTWVNPAMKDEAKGLYGHGGYMGHLTEMRDAIEKGGPITSDGRNGRANVVIARGILEQCGAPLPGPTIG